MKILFFATGNHDRPAGLHLFLAFPTPSHRSLSLNYHGYTIFMVIGSEVYGGYSRGLPKSGRNIPLDSIRLLVLLENLMAIIWTPDARVSGQATRAMGLSCWAEDLFPSIDCFNHGFDFNIGCDHLPQENPYGKKSGQGGYRKPSGCYFGRNHPLLGQ